jgi:hypothetical protein
MTKHTRYPWTVESDQTTVSMGDQVVIVGPAPDGASRAEMIANARLIASAPDLLAALQSMLDADDAICNNVGRGVDQAMSRIAAIDSARAAIARAQGE